MISYRLPKAGKRYFFILFYDIILKGLWIFRDSYRIKRLKTLRVGLVIPTLNAGKAFEALLKEIAEQEAALAVKLVADSESQDDTVKLAQQYGYQIELVQREKFNHGGTRALCVEKLQGKVDVVAFITQDVRFYDVKALRRLLSAFDDPDVGAAYGRQLPHKGASLTAAQARLFNYPAASAKKTYSDRSRIGMKAAFLSDSFAAYRVTALKEVGGFPDDVIVSEDMYVGAKLLQQGYSVAYVAEAQVCHSHEYTLLQELRRYFDIGVFQARESWIRRAFGAAEGEGVRLMLDQIRFLLRHGKYGLAFKSIFANAVKWLGYRLGLKEAKLPKWFKRLCSAQPYYFK